MCITYKKKDTLTIFSIKQFYFILQGASLRGGREKGPKITITKVPSIDQSSLEFLYPIQVTSDGSETSTSATVVFLENDKNWSDISTTTTRSFIQRELEKSACFSKGLCDKVVMVKILNTSKFFLM